MSSPGQPSSGADDAVGRRLAALAARLERSLHGVASLRREDLGRGAWELVPECHDAVGVAWIDWGDALHLEVLGGEGGRWELRRADSDVQFLVDVVDAVVDGRVIETFGHRRSRVTVTLADGSHATETGYAPGGCLPQPLWTRRGRRQQYSPYR